MDLTNRKCVPCEGGVDKFGEAQIQAFMPALEKDWEVRDGMMIRREYSFPNFVQAMAFANKVGDLAEVEGHHPYLHVTWGKVIVDIWTHAIDGLCENDFILAAKVDQLSA